MINSFNQLLETLKGARPRTLVLAGAEEKEALLAVAEARDLGLAGGFLVGNAEKVRDLALQHGIALHGFELVDEPDRGRLGSRAAQLASQSGADILVKGAVSSADYLRGLLNKELGFVRGRLLSHVGVIESAGYDHLLLLTDGAMNIAPTLEQKQQICQNAVSVAHALGRRPALVAALAAVETVNPSMPATLDAALLSKMSERGQIAGAVVDGPLGLDNAISPKALAMKGINSPLGGNADVLLVPDIEAGNVIYKTMVYFGQVKAAGVVVGATIPVALNSRSDTHESRLLSLALCAYLAERV